MSVIHVKDLRKIYQVPEREAGLIASMKSLVKRKYKEVKAVDGITFEIGATLLTFARLFWQRGLK